MADILINPLFGLALSLLCMYLGLWISKKLPSPLTNPLFLAILLVISVLTAFQIPYESYKQGGDVLSLFVAPATAMLAVNIYRQWALLKANLWPVLGGCFVGSLSSIASVYLLCRAFGLDAQMTISLLPKSVTTPFAMELSAMAGGLPAISVVAVLLSGITGPLIAPFLIRLFRLKDAVCTGLALGASSHAIGTSYAMEKGEVQGAASSVAIGITGLFTVVWMLLLSK